MVSMRSQNPIRSPHHLSNVFPIRSLPVLTNVSLPRATLAVDVALTTTYRGPSLHCAIFVTLPLCHLRHSTIVPFSLRYHSAIFITLPLCHFRHSHSLIHSRIACDMSAVSLLESGEQRYVKPINNNKCKEPRERQTHNVPWSGFTFRYHIYTTAV